MKKLMYLVFAAGVLCSCMNGKADPSMDSGMDRGGGSSGGSADHPNDSQQYAGKVTAGEWRDLDNWLFWSNLMTNAQGEDEDSNFAKFCDYWQLYTNNRIAVRVTNDASEPQRDVPVQVKNGNAVLYEGRTDNRGEVNLFVALMQKQDSVDDAKLTLVVNGVEQTEPIVVTGWGQEPKWNTCKANVTASKQIDVAFIVDATGSMSDEIDFLKADLQDIIGKVSKDFSSADIRTAALFYRDEGDEYVTRANDFASDVASTAAFVDKQEAGGGGDYPEAVHTALEKGLQELSWREDNCIRLAFMLLDAPPHKQDDVIHSLQASIPQYAKQGIRIIPVAASGVDKPTEFFLRFAAIATDATYVFITNDSGIGNEHIVPTVGEYKVELLNDLITRLIGQYLQ